MSSSVRPGARRRALSTRVAALAVATSAVLVAAGCSSSGDSSSGGGATDASADISSVSLKVGQTGWAQTKAALEVAGLDNTPYTLEWPVFSGGDQQLQALQSSALDVAQSSEIPPVFAAAGGTVKFKQVAVQTGSTLFQEVVVTKNSPITSIAGLKGKKVGYVKNTTAAYFLNELLKESGLSWKDIQPRPLLPNDGLAALNGGSIDAFASYGNTIIQAHQNGARTIGSGEKILSGNFPWSVTTSLLSNASKKAAVVDLLARIDKAWRYVRAGHEQAYADKFAAATKQPVASALKQVQLQEAQRPTGIEPPTQTVIDSQQKVADSFLEIKALPSKVDVADLWSDELAAPLTTALAGTSASVSSTPVPSASAVG
ncbi:ABC transporter substrate-binding protein [Gordonia jinhuaensis]|uniref:ABC transporter substrate-binding protein n=1 Tax=Gordonia jinhuaensis TaxID=1517702 RepID=UPI001E37AA7B|nr:ABC transporter substrate-binding protein [Gordonia jinhuaensis]